MLEQEQAGQLKAESVADATTQALHFLGNTHAHISTEQRKRIINHFNVDLRPLVEDADRFRSAAPLLLGKDFEKWAKENVDSVQSLGSAHGGHRQPQFFFIRPPPHLLSSCSWGRHLPTRQQTSRKRPLPSVTDSKGESASKRWRPTMAVKLPPSTGTPEIVYIYPQLQLLVSVNCQQELLPPTQSCAVQTLQSRGVTNVARELALRSFPLAGCLMHFLPNWQAITSDEWLFNTMVGYRIDFLQKPYQHRPPPPIVFTKEEEECMQTEIQSMLGKQAISETSQSPEGFYSLLFLVP